MSDLNIQCCVGSGRRWSWAYALVVHALIVWMTGISPAWAEGAVQPSAGAPTVSPALPSSLPVRRDAAPVWETGGIGVLGALSVVLLVAGTLAWGLRRGMVVPRAADRSAAVRDRWMSLWSKLPNGKPQEELRMVRSLRLTPRASVHVIEWDGRQWLVGASDHAVALLGERPASCTVPDAAPLDNGSERSAS